MIGGLHKFSKSVVPLKTDDAFLKMQLKNLQDSMHLMKLGQQPQLSLAFSAPS
jgi:hypothetical protein